MYVLHFLLIVDGYNRIYTIYKVKDIRTALAFGFSVLQWFFALKIFTGFMQYHRQVGPL